MGERKISFSSHVGTAVSSLLLDQFLIIFQSYWSVSFILINILNETISTWTSSPLLSSQIFIFFQLLNYPLRKQPQPFSSKFCPLTELLLQKVDKHLQAYSMPFPAGIPVKSSEDDIDPQSFSPESSFLKAQAISRSLGNNLWRSCIPHGQVLTLWMKVNAWVSKEELFWHLLILEPSNQDI